MIQSRPLRIFSPGSQTVSTEKTAETEKAKTAFGFQPRR